jgi:DNA-directed RNA polymerase specialized sigma24 family protein
MSEAIVGAARRLRRYAHAVLGAWPRDDALPQADQDADDLAQKALLDMRRGGFEQNFDELLIRKATMLARRHSWANAGEIPASDGQGGENTASGESAGHFAWAPEARALPRLPLDLRAILALVVLERLSYAEAGRALDMPEERALARLAVARARLASEIAGAAHVHLVSLPPAEAAVTEGDLHRFADNLLDEKRTEEIAAFLKASPAAARRVAEWRRQSERLRGAFAPLVALPLPPSSQIFFLVRATAPRRAFSDASARY